MIELIISLAVGFAVFALTLSIDDVVTPIIRGWADVDSE